MYVILRLSQFYPRWRGEHRTTGVDHLFRFYPAGGEHAPSLFSRSNNFRFIPAGAGTPLC